VSLKAVVWALENDDVFSSAQKFVLVALANYASEEGKSYPAVATVCRLTKQSDDTVRRCLEQLKESGLIADTGKRFGPTQQVRVWQLPDEAWKVKDPLGAGLKDPGKTPARPALRGSNLRTLEPSGEEAAAGAPATPPKFPPQKPSPVRAFTDLWCNAFKANFGMAYDFKGGKDGQAAARLVKLATPEELIGTARQAWKQTDRRTSWACVTQSTELCSFAAAFNKIRIELRQRATPRRTTHNQNL
jgi:hypothetical protein